MDKQAVNIALVPEKSMYLRVLKLNSELISRGSDLILGQKSIAHITLVQGVVNKEGLNQTLSILEKIANQTAPLDLTANELFIGPMSKSVWLKVQRNENIYSLHKNVLLQTAPYLTYDAEKQMFANPDEITNEVAWVKDFPTKSVLENYKPHVTLGFGKIEVIFPIKFKADKLVIYQLGKYCGCSKEIKTFNLE